MRILLIEDEDALADAMRTRLAKADHAIDWVKTLQAAADVSGATDYGLMLLDLNLPDGNGLSFLCAVRESGDSRPVIIITAHDQISDRIAGLNAGADDYIIKPFDLDELVARVEAVQRRYSGNPNPQVALGDIRVDTASNRLWVKGAEMFLTGRE